MHPTLPDSLFFSLSDLLAERMGLNFPAQRWGDLERGLKAAAPALGLPDAASCAHRLLSAPLTHREIEILAGCLTIGETYFFREKQGFEAIERHILPALLRKREDSERRLRIWSAGCCTGEEPYSIAMLLDRLIANTDTWHITILATDINPTFLRKAVAGEYGEWSFRGTPSWLRRRYFHAKRDGCFRIDEHIRRRVTFSFLNLADDAFPSLANNTNAMDIIFCRNVLMYFTAAQAARVVANFHRALVDGGWLIVSPCETSNTLFSRFARVESSGAILYRKTATVASPRAVSQVSPVSNVDFGQVARPPAARSVSGTMALRPPPPAPLPVDTPDKATPPPTQEAPLSRTARDYANQGRLNEAAEWCRKAIAADKLNPVHYYLLSAIQQEQGQGDDAVQSLTRTLYLAPDFVLAHYALGNLRLSQGRYREAGRHFENTLTLLRAHPEEEILPESDGLSAGRLAEIVASMKLSMQGLVNRQP